MLGELACAYLFFGGVGAGALGICCTADLFFMRQPFGCAAYAQGPSVNKQYRILDYAFAAGLFILGAGILCLFFDLGRTDRVMSLFFSSTPTLINVGAYCLALLFLVGAFLTIVRLMYLPGVSRRAVSVVEVAGIILSVAVMLYTGFLLRTLSGVAAWNSLWLPVLFGLSSLSGGIAIVILCSAFVSTDRAVATLACRFACIDLFVILLEVICTIAFLFDMGSSANPGARASFAMLIQGCEAQMFWIGFVLCGMLFPLLVELIFGFMRKASFEGCLRALAIGAVLVLVGAFSLRWALVEVGQFRDIELQRPPGIHLEMPDEQMPKGE